MIQDKSWEITEEFWIKVEPFLARTSRATDKEYKKTIGGGRKPMPLR